MTLILHFSDTHFGTETPAVLQAALAAAHELAPDIVILSGDITQRARAAQFAAAARFLAALPAKAKTITIPGNHDICLYDVFSRFFLTYRRYEHYLGLTETIWHKGNMAVAGFNATSPWRHTRGKLDLAHADMTLAKLRRTLTDDVFLAVAVHQPLATIRPEDHTENLIDAHATAELFARHRVDLVLSGHVHAPYVTATGGLYAQLPRHFLFSGAGTTFSRRTREGAPNAFNTIRIAHSEGQKAEITVWYYNAGAGEFRPEAPAAFILSEKGWTNGAEL